MTREIGTGVERKGNTWMLVPTPPWGDEQTQWEELSKEKNGANVPVLMLSFPGIVSAWYRFGKDWIKSIFFFR